MPRNLYAWFATGYAPFQSLESVFDVPDEYRLDNVPLWLALLNAAHSGVDYPLTEAEVISEVNAALASGDRMTMLRLAQELTRYNNGFCPLR